MGTSCLYHISDCQFSEDPSPLNSQFHSFCLNRHQFSTAPPREGLPPRYYQINPEKHEHVSLRLLNLMILFLHTQNQVQVCWHGFQEPHCVSILHALIHQMSHQCSNRPHIKREAYEIQSVGHTDSSSVGVFCMILSWLH